MPRIAVRKHAAAVFCTDAASNHLSRVQDAAMGHCTAKWRTLGDNGSDIRWPLRRYSARDNPSRTMTDQMNFATGCG